jgi:hypothetical protein
VHLPIGYIQLQPYIQNSFIVRLTVYHVKTNKKPLCNLIDITYLQRFKDEEHTSLYDDQRHHKKSYSLLNEMCSPWFPGIIYIPIIILISIAIAIFFFWFLYNNLYYYLEIKYHAEMNNNHIIGNTLQGDKIQSTINFPEVAALKLMYDFIIISIINDF